MHTCLICNSNKTITTPTKVSEFLTERMLAGEPTTTNLIHCLHCGFAYYTYRPTNDDMGKLYTGYRNRDYQRQRQKHEGWYTPEINSIIGNNNYEIHNRKKNLDHILNQFIPIDSVHTVLDFGGDRGQHIPSAFKSKKKYVYDISGAPTLDGIHSITTLDEAQKQKYDFIMCCHTLEHVSSPQSILHDIINIANNGAYLYVELPFDSPFYKNKFRELKFIFNKYFTLSTLIKEYIKSKKSKYFAPMHEHINFFTPKSIQYFLESLGFTIIYNDVSKINCQWVTQNVISTLAKLR